MAVGTEESPVSTGEDLSGKRIIRVLAVDDNEVQLLMLCRCLEQCGYKVTRFTDPNQVLEHLRENKENFDLVISDLHMPKYEDGLKLIKHVVLKMDLPVIVVSDKSSIEEAQQGILNGACVFVVKPVPLEFVKRIWQYALPKGKITKNENNLNPPPNPNIKNDNNKDRMLESNNGDASSRSMKKRKGAMEEDENGEDTGDDDGSGSVSRKTKKKGKRFTWTKELHGLFIGAIDQLGGVKNAVPKRIQSIMAVKGLTREHVASHLQKHRQMLQKNEKAQQGELPNALPFTNQPFASQQVRTPLSSYCKTYSIPPSMVANILPVQNSMNAPVFMTNSNNMPLSMYPRQQQQPNHLLMSQCESDFKSLQQFGNNNNNNNNIMSYIANVLNAAVPSSPLVFCNNVSNDEYNINNLGNNSSNNGNNGLMGNGFMGNTSSGMESTNTGYRETHLPPNLQPRAVFNNCGEPLNNSNNNGNSGLMGNRLMGNTSYILQNRFAMEGKESFNTGYNNCVGTMNNLDYSGQIIQCDGLLSVPPVIRKEAEEKNQSGFQEKAKEKNQLGFQEIADEE